MRLLVFISVPVILWLIWSQAVPFYLVVGQLIDKKFGLLAENGLTIYGHAMDVWGLVISALVLLVAYRVTRPRD